MRRCDAMLRTDDIWTYTYGTQKRRPTVQTHTPTFTHTHTEEPAAEKCLDTPAGYLHMGAHLAPSYECSHFCLVAADRRYKFMLNEESYFSISCLIASFLASDAKLTSTELIAKVLISPRDRCSCSMQDRKLSLRDAPM
mmetsp:Transcript_14205/g.40844  ORF Transcript_14205/g.40844 Transcript_14205/m.40844 type:complete len:139 (+) Transcript_14205:167-583(+)